MTVRPTPGISDVRRRACLIAQIIESIRRIEYVETLLTRDISPLRAEPTDPLFDPIKAAIYYCRNGDLEEAFWMVFLFVHFGKHRTQWWRCAAAVYGRLGQEGRWNWGTVSNDIEEFGAWAEDNVGELRGVCRFGNHRKYESITQLGAVVESYVEWIDPPRMHQELFGQIYSDAGRDAHTAFDLLYRSMRRVHRFGRTAVFDYLTMVGKLGLAPIEPPIPYIAGSTGPRAGASLLFGGGKEADLELMTTDLGNQLGLRMQVLEDALCNWQKSPARFLPFRG